MGMDKREEKGKIMENVYRENETMKSLDMQDYGVIYSEEVLDMIKNISIARQESISMVMALDIFMAGYTYRKK